MNEMDGTEYALWEVDQELIELIPQMKRKMYRDVVTQAIDELLDQRNEIIAIAACLAVEQERL